MKEYGSDESQSWKEISSCSYNNMDELTINIAEVKLSSQLQDISFAHCTLQTPYIPTMKCRKRGRIV